MCKCINMDETTPPSPGHPRRRIPHKEKSPEQKHRDKENKRKNRQRDADLRRAVVQLKQDLINENFDDLHKKIHALDVRDSNGQHNDNAQLAGITNQVAKLTAGMATLESKFYVLDERCKKCCPSY